MRRTMTIQWFHQNLAFRSNCPKRLPKWWFHWFLLCYLSPLFSRWIPGSTSNSITKLRSIWPLRLTIVVCRSSSIHNCLRIAGPHINNQYTFWTMIQTRPHSTQCFGIHYPIRRVNHSTMKLLKNNQTKIPSKRTRQSLEWLNLMQYIRKLIMEPSLCWRILSKVWQGPRLLSI